MQQQEKKYRLFSKIFDDPLFTHQWYIVSNILCICNRTTCCPVWKQLPTAFCSLHIFSQSVLEPSRSLQKNYFTSIMQYLRDLMKCSRKFYGMQVSMTKQCGDF